MLSYDQDLLVNPIKEECSCDQQEKTPLSTDQYLQLITVLVETGGSVEDTLMLTRKRTDSMDVNDNSLTKVSSSREITRSKLCLYL